MRRFSKTEWSGPAWYRVDTTTDRGFPIKVTLMHFIPIDLGDSTATEMDAEILAPLLPKVYKENTHLKDCYLGMIHSHHGMGAFFSGTDETALLEQAPAEGLFFSTVVAHTKDRFATAVSYQDQFGYPNYIEGDVKTKVKYKSEQGWRDEADKIEEANKAIKPIYGSYGNKAGYGYYNNQYNAFDTMAPKSKKEPKVTTRLLTGATIEEVETVSIEDVKMEQISELYNKFEANEITQNEFIAQARIIEPDIEPYSWVDELTHI